MKPKLSFIDTETCGLYSMPVLLQYAFDDEEINLYDIWLRPVGETLALMERIAERVVVGFNLTFDWFQFTKLYSIWTKLPKKWAPIEHINEIAAIEPAGRDGLVIKPYSAMDLMLHGRKGPLQSLMSRSDITIRRVPRVLAETLAAELETQVEIDGIYFARRKDKEAPHWKVMDIQGDDGYINPDFQNVVLKFAPSGGLKYIAEHILGFKPKYHYEDVEPPEDWYPVELGYAPFASAVSSEKDGWLVHEDGKVVGHAWPACVERFVKHWAENKPAREYAYDDIVYTRALYKHFDEPEHGDDDSILSCMVPIVRWRGFKIDVDAIKERRAEEQLLVDNAPVMITSPAKVREYLTAAMDDVEQICLEDTGKDTLQKLRKLSFDPNEIGETCSKCDGGGCERCDGHGKVVAFEPPTPEVGNHPVAIRADRMLKCKTAIKEVELYDKLLRAGRFHASFTVIGTLSSRMAGADGLNPQGIKATKVVRRMFPLADESKGEVLSGGDFDAYEVTLADAEYNDPALRKDLLSGKKIHALLATCMYEELKVTYEDVMASEGQEFDMYTNGKRGVFGIFYGGDAGTLERNCSINRTAAERTFDLFGQRYPGFNKSRAQIFDTFAALTQREGEGTAISWKDPQEYVESFLGFRRYFTLEWKIVRALFEMARNPPKAFRSIKHSVMRSPGRVQTAGGATASALYGAAFGIQGKIQRAAGNHKIQSPGGQITKRVQRVVWDLQPCGPGELFVCPMNVHDELMVVNRPEFTDRVCDAVIRGTEEFRKAVPLIGMSWFKEMSNWAEKKASEGKVSISHRGVVYQQAA